ncbi:hypothetical protein DF16_pBMB400orf00146 (plasmid) [Bacillus thuringiensis serovar kurstaki str. YBT-1520]|nr:hypothetical protein DF16_pBMB400orf00146 [Bacillus thuringiensis serovar kurstaki str. YBT-1520]
MEFNQFKSLMKLMNFILNLLLVDGIKAMKQIYKKICRRNN